jgi:hypothetical protein
VLPDAVSYAFAAWCCDLGAFAVAVDHIKYGDERLAVPQSVFNKGYRSVACVHVSYACLSAAVLVAWL